MTRDGHLALVHSSPAPGSYPEGVVCGPCSEYFGFAFKPMVTIKPQRAMRQPDGSIALDQPVILCSQCERRGHRTILF